MKSMSEFVLLQRPSLITLIWKAGGSGKIPGENRLGGANEIIQMLMGSSICNLQESLHLNLRSSVIKKKKPFQKLHL
jgi:hypothetical protein